MKPSFPDLELGMKQMLPLTRFKTRLKSQIRRFVRSRSGIGAIEFAILAPLLIVLYLGTLEATVALNVYGKVARASSSIGDLVAAQSPSVDKTFLATMPDVVSSILAPFSSTSYTLKMTGIKLDSASKATVDWSWDKSGSRPYTVGVDITANVPTDLQIASSYLIRSELSVPYTMLLYLPGMSGTQAKALTMTKVYYFSPRVGTSVTCPTC
jgi:Flp pilus assembly protein TadG